jgi:hypothetical protein
MYAINKRILENSFDNDIILYEDFMKSASKEYREIIKELSKAKTSEECRTNVHKLISTIIYLEDTNAEILYFCKLLLNIDKKNTDINFYKSYVNMIVEYDRKKIGFL